MDIPGRKKTKVGTCTRDEKPSLVRVACALRGMLDDVIQGVGESPGIQKLLEYAAQNMIIEGVSAQEPGIEQKDGKTAESVTTCAHSCAHHAQLMDISLWSKLPEDLQELVFAHLPWPQIYRVRILSKVWNEKLVSGAKGSQFKQACVRAQPKSFALLAPEDGPGSFAVNMFDIASNRWHSFGTSPGDFPKCGESRVIASDGGLVCFLLKVESESKKTPHLVFVCNPLTRVWKQLPLLFGIIQQMIMVKLIMDHRTKHYRVIVVGFGKDPEVRNVVKVYHSKTGKWTKAADSASVEVVYGYLYKLNSGNCKPVPCSYNFADGVVHEIVTDFPRNYAHESDLVKDHLFRLKDVDPAGGLSTYCIEEYEAVDCGASWTPLKEYPLSRLPRTAHHIKLDGMGFSIHFFACNDFLLLFQVPDEQLEDNRWEFLWLYDFSEEEWRELPMMPGGYRLFHVRHQLCELRFDAIP